MKSSRNSPLGVTERGRTLHILDIENLCGTARPDNAEVAFMVDRYSTAMDVLPGDQLVMAASSGGTAFAAKLARPSAQVLFRKGQDGADRAILETVQPRLVSSRFGRVILGSGDHIFAGLADEMSELGVFVEIVSLPGSLAAHHRTGRCRIRHFDGRQRESHAPRTWTSTSHLTHSAVGANP